MQDMMASHSPSKGALPARGMFGACALLEIKSFRHENTRSSFAPQNLIYETVLLATAVQEVWSLDERLLQTPLHISARNRQIPVMRRSTYHTLNYFTRSQTGIVGCAIGLCNPYVTHPNTVIYRRIRLAVWNVAGEPRICFSDCIDA